MEPDEKPTEAIKAAKPLDIESEPATHTTDLSPTQSEPEAQANVGAGTSFEDLENTDLFLMNVPQPEEETSEEEESSENEGSEVVEQFVDAEGGIELIINSADVVVEEANGVERDESDARVALFEDAACRH